MNESDKKIISDSNKMINKLLVISNFFEDEVIYKIYVRSKVIQKIFEDNETLDKNKLSLFHLQFTESILELLRRIKKTNEKNVNILLDEIHMNNELINNLSDEMLDADSFEKEKLRHTNKMNLALRQFYQMLSGLSDAYPFNNTAKFATKFAKDFYIEIEPSVYDDFVNIASTKVYTHDLAVIDKKLMGLQCKHEFKNKFIAGYKSGAHLLEVFEIEAEEVFFLFQVHENKFWICPYDKIAAVKPSENQNKKGRVVQELKNKNRQIEYAMAIQKTRIPEEVTTLLTEYYRKIEGMNFLDFIDDLDVQTNILRVMLDTKTM